MVDSVDSCFGSPYFTISHDYVLFESILTCCRFALYKQYSYLHLLCLDLHRSLPVLDQYNQIAMENVDDYHTILTPLVCDYAPALTGFEAKFPTLNNSIKKNRYRSLSSSCHEIVEEIFALSRISGPSTVTGLLIYMRNLVSMVFLGYLGHMSLAAGALSKGFANITGYSIIFGLAMGMETICGQAYGAEKWTIVGLTLHRTIAILLLTSLPISILWLNVDRILVHLGQDSAIIDLTKTYLMYSLPDLIAQSIIHPLRIYLRSQNITGPVAVCSSISSLLHIPLNYYLVVVLKTGIKGVAAAVVLTNFSFILLLACYINVKGLCSNTWTRVTMDCFKEWGSIFTLAIPSCISMCLEWWWYELLIILCGLLKSPERTVSAIGILMQMTALIYVFPSSLSYGVSTRVANELGAGRPDKARRAATAGTTCGLMVGFTAMAFNIWSQRWWGPMFTDNAGVLELVAAALPVVGLCELGNCPQTVMCGVMRGSARADLSAHINLGGFYGVGLPVALCFGFWMRFGFAGLWLGLLAAQAWCAVVLGVVLLRTNWNLQVKRAEQLTRCKEVVQVVDEGNQMRMVAP